jgi:hypothetical protein
MKKGMLLMVLVALMVIPLVSYADTKDKCQSKCLNLCSNKNDEDHAGCMTVCMDRCLHGNLMKSRNLSELPKFDLNSSTLYAEAGTGKESVTKNIVVASVFDDNDQPCYVGGKYVRNCSRNKPYYNAFSGECYPTLQECKKADGDLANVQGSGGCVRCGK